MTTKQPPDFNNIAAEALDLWQQHLANLSADPVAKADLAQMMEPSRRMFADWMQKAQDATHGAASFTPNPSPTNARAEDTHGAASAGLASDDGSLRLAQLGLHVAELEKRVAALEAKKPCAPRKAAGASRTK